MLFTGIRPCEWRDTQILTIKEMCEILEIDKNQTQELDGIWLKVINAKNTNNRTHGEFRYLYIGLLKNIKYSREEKETIYTQISVLKEHISQINNFHQQVLNHEYIDIDFEEKYKNAPKGWFTYYQHRCSQKLLQAREYRYKQDQILQNAQKFYKNGKLRKLKPVQKKYISLYSFRHQFSANLKSTNTSKGEIAYLMGHKSLFTADLCYAGIRHSYSNLKPKTALKLPNKIAEQLNNLKSNSFHINSDFKVNKNTNNLN